MIKIADPSEFKSGDIPTDPGVYLYRDEAGEILYVGKAKSPDLSRGFLCVFGSTSVIHGVQIRDDNGG